jgi:hypothetical protein
MPPDPIQGGAPRVQAVLARTAARIRARHLLRATAVGVLAAAGTQLILAVLQVPGRGLTRVVPAVVAAAVVLLQRRRGTPRAAAAALERADPSLRNLVVTAAQLLESPDMTRPYMRERVFRETAHRAGAIDVRKAVPLMRDALVLIAAIVAVLLTASIRMPAHSVLSGITPSPEPGAAPSAFDLVVDLTPPPYTGRQASRLVNPATLDVLGGTDAVVRAPGGQTAPIRVNGTPIPVRPDGTAHVVFRESGYVAVDAGPVQRLVPLTVTPDRAPDVRIAAPAKDLRVPSTAAAIPIAADATDDLGLASFELRYTVVSGSGEQFTFTEGTLASAVQRTTDRSWRLETALSLAKLGLGPGDALIYRAVAADRRPGGAGIAASDTFFVEIAGPGDVPLEGVEMPPEKERYALSQAMIVLKLERLRAREKTLARDALAEETGNIAAEQRAVRANFIFLLGGEVEDEEVEAEHSHEISEGRFANQARKEIVGATVLMGQVEKALAAVSTREALPPARAAVKALQRAFGHSRYLLRALPSRVRIDPARRLSGDISAAADWHRALAPMAPDAGTEAARAALADLLAASAALDSPADAAPLNETLRGLAERLLTAAARAPDLRPAAAEVAAARQALASGQRDIAREALRRAAGPLVTRAQQGRIQGSRVSPGAARLAGAAAAGGGVPK